jgi:hypothetical protein
MFSRHEEFAGVVQSTANEAFALLDDQTRLSKHMSKRSWTMGWGKMNIIVDERRGMAVGSHIVLRGRVFGIPLFLNEVVVARDVSRRKVWETVGEPRLLVIGRYQMGFEIAPSDAGAHLRVSIDYELPSGGMSRLFGHAFGRTYARWCTRQMVLDAQSSLGGGAARGHAA